MQNEKEIRRLMQTGMESDSAPSRALTAVSRARRQVGQRDTLSFALIKVWSVLARLLAPFFAAISERQARAVHQHSAARSSAVRPAAKQHSNTNQNEGESQ